VRLTRKGRQLPQKIAGIDLRDACSLTPAQFTRLGGEIAALRDSLVAAAQGER
jgi:MarR family transcriptional regulator, organic hydroperoxide resistance regulator